MIDHNLIRALHNNLPKGKSLNDTISDVLDISYDAAHRRASGKSKFSLEEGTQLAKHFGLSLDKLFGTNQKDIVAVEKTLLIANEKDLEDYYKKSYTEISSIPNKDKCNILYSAKDIPLFYTLNNEILCKFKAFVWLKILDPKFKNLSYTDYIPKPTLLKGAKKLGSLYALFKRTEIWDITTINSLLKQIHFYFLSQQLPYNEALEITKELHLLINDIEQKLVKNDPNILLYHNELLLMNNSVLIKSNHTTHLYIPFTMLSYYRTNDKHTCQQAEDFLIKQLSNSKLLNTSGEKEQKTFFHKIYTKINALEQLIKATLTLDFQ